MCHASNITTLSFFFCGAFFWWANIFLVGKSFFIWKVPFLSRTRLYYCIKKCLLFTITFYLSHSQYFYFCPVGSLIHFGAIGIKQNKIFKRKLTSTQIVYHTCRLISTLDSPGKQICSVRMILSCSVEFSPTPWEFVQNRGEFMLLLSSWGFSCMGWGEGANTSTSQLLVCNSLPRPLLSTSLMLMMIRMVSTAYKMFCNLRDFLDRSRSTLSKHERSEHVYHVWLRNEHS